MVGLIETFDLKGKFTVEHRRNGELIGVYEVPNGITNEGLDEVLDVMFHNTSQHSTWYMGLIDNSGYTGVAAGDTYTSHSGWTENTDYDETFRGEWTEGAASSQQITNASAVQFSMNATVTIKGMFLCNVSTKGDSSSGVLWCTGLFSSTVSCVNGDTLSVTYTLSAA